MRHGRKLSGLVLTLLTVINLPGCAPSTPLFVANVGTRELARHEDQRLKVAQAIIDEEGDLFTYSVDAIINGQSAQAEKTYLNGYTHIGFSNQIKAIALYQVALIYKSSYNRERNYPLSLNYLYRIVNEFPETRAADYARPKIIEVENLIDNPVKFTPDEKLADWEQIKRVPDPRYAKLDQAMNSLSKRAVVKNRTDEVIELYTLVYRERGMPTSLRADALLQIALIYSSQPQNADKREQTLAAFRKVSREFPSTRFQKTADQHLDILLNQQEG